VDSLKLPIIIFLIGIALVSVNFIQLFYDITLWKNIISATTDIGNAFISLSIVVFFYRLIASITKEYEHALSASHHRVKAHILSVIHRGLRLIFVYIAIYTLISIFELRHQSLDIAHKIISVFFIASIAWIVLQILSTLEVYYYHQYSSAEGADSRWASSVYTKIHQIRNVVVIIVVVIATAASLMVFDSVRNIGISILASAGFLTAIVGLAAQKTLGSVFAGIQLAFSQPFGIGDWVMVENELGTVEELTLSNVVVEFWDSRRLILPISYFIEKPFTNLSRDHLGIAGSVKFYVDYALPIEPVRNELLKIVADNRYWDKRIASLSVSAFKDNVVELTIKLSSNNPDNLSNLSNDVREKLLEYIRKTYPEGLPKFRIDSK
jgi:small-conductance mechanosensitive channel